MRYYERWSKHQQSLIRGRSLLSDSVAQNHTLFAEITPACMDVDVDNTSHARAQKQ